jgi:hypothetical protein
MHLACGDGHGTEPSQIIAIESKALYVVFDLRRRRRRVPYLYMRLGKLTFTFSKQYGTFVAQKAERRKEQPVASLPFPLQHIWSRSLTSPSRIL